MRTLQFSTALLTARERGATAYALGLPLADCPYPHRTALAQAWAAAYLQAEAQRPAGRRYGAPCGAGLPA